MNKYEIAGLAGAIAQVSNNGLEPNKGLKLYRFYQEFEKRHLCEGCEHSAEGK